MIKVKIPILLLGTLALSIACGGGGGGGGGSSSVLSEYTGNQSKAEIDSSNASIIADDLELSDDLDRNTNSFKPGNGSKNSIQAFIHHLAFQYLQNNKFKVFSDSYTEESSNGGSAQTSYRYDDENGDFSYTTIFNNFEQGYWSYVLNGKYSFDHKGLNTSLKFENLSMQLGQNYILNGTVTLEYDDNTFLSFTETTNLVLKIDGSDFCIAWIDVIERWNSITSSRIQSGKVYHYQYGYMDIFSLTSKTYSGSWDTTANSGSTKYLGENNSNMVISYSNGTYSVDQVTSFGNSNETSPPVDALDFYSGPATQATITLTNYTTLAHDILLHESMTNQKPGQNSDKRYNSITQLLKELNPSFSRHKIVQDSFIVTGNVTGSLLYDYIYDDSSSNSDYYSGVITYENYSIRAGITYNGSISFNVNGLTSTTIFNDLTLTYINATYKINGSILSLADDSSHDTGNSISSILITNTNTDVEIAFIDYNENWGPSELTITSGKAYHSLYGYVNVTSLEQSIYSNRQDAFPNSGIKLFEGADNSKMTVTEQDGSISISLDANGDEVEDDSTNSISL